MPVARSITCLHRCISLLTLAVLWGCSEPPASAPLPRVKVMTVTTGDYAATATITGDIQAQVQTELSFRVSGKIIERRVEVGEQITANQVLARLDPQDLQNNLQAAQAAAQATEVQYKLAGNNLWRQQQLLPKGYTSQSEYDAALANQRSAKNALDAAKAQLADAREQLGYTELRAEADGVITARHAEVGQVVQATAPIFSLARDGERDAVFNVYEALLAAPSGQAIEVFLLDDPQVRTQGRVREVTPAVSAQSGTVQVKVALQNPPAAMGLGATVSASVSTQAANSIELPWSALTKAQHQPAVWRLDKDDVVDLQPVQIGRYLTDKVIIQGGLNAGDRVVVAGGQLLHPQQQVEIANEPKQEASP
ncbi:efflux RND transporter periplasmic adaptor subunit [Pseudomonas sp. Marseille-Q8238]